jgi:diguanylate cyclase (GGDEF)-like protein
MSKKILLVDDDSRFQATIAPVLKSRGYTVVIATNAREAGLESQSTPDLLIVDGQLPDGDGILVIEEFRKHNSNTPVIFVSATWRDTESYHKLTKQLLCRSILHKPILPAVLAQEVDKILDYSSNLPVPRPAAAVALQEKLSALSQVFAKELPAAISEIEELIKLAKNEKGLTSAGEAGRKAHKLRGTAASYGFPRVSNLMASIEDTLTGHCMGANTRSPEAIWKDILDCLKECRAEAAKAPTPCASFQAAGQTASIAALIISNDDAIDSMLSQYASEKDTELHRCSMESADKLLKEKHFDLLFIDAATVQDKVWDLINTFRKDSKNQRVPIALIKTDTSNTCTEEIYHGTDFTLNRPLSAQALHAAFQHLFELRTELSSKVLVIDDDSYFIRRAESLLSAEGIKVTSFMDTNRLFEILPDLKPDLVLLDIDMPGISGFDVCRKLRESEQWHSLPVMFVSARTNWETRVAAYDCGGDDYLSKPVINVELMQKTRLWLERSKHRTRTHDLDSLTGLYNHSAFAERAQSLLEKTAGVGKEFTLVFFKITNVHQVNQDHSARAGDQLLRATANLLKRYFPMHAVRGRWSGTILALAINAHKTFAEQAAKQFVESLAKELEGAKLKPVLELSVFSTREESCLYKLVK